MSELTDDEHAKRVRESLDDAMDQLENLKCKRCGSMGAITVSVEELVHSKLCLDCATEAELFTTVTIRALTATVKAGVAFRESLKVTPIATGSFNSSISDFLKRNTRVIKGSLEKEAEFIVKVRDWIRRGVNK